MYAHSLLDPGGAEVPDRVVLPLRPHGDVLNVAGEEDGDGRLPVVQKPQCLSVLVRVFLLRHDPGERAVVPLPEVFRLLRLRPFQLDAVDAAPLVVPAVRLGLVAGVLVVPVGQVDVAERAPLHVEGADVLVARDEEVVAAGGREGTAVGLEDVLLDAAAVDGAEDDARSVLFGHVRHVEGEEPGVGPAALAVEGVVADFLDLAVRVRVEGRPRLPLVVSAANDVIQVRDDAAAEDELAVGVPPVHAPGVRGALGEDLELFVAGVVPPDAGVDFDRRAGGVSPLLVFNRGLTAPARLDDFTMAANTVQAVQPAVGAPLEGVERLVRVLAAAALEEDFELARLVVLVLDEPEVGRGPEEDAAAADLD